MWELFGQFFYTLFKLFDRKFYLQKNKKNYPDGEGTIKKDIVMEMEFVVPDTYVNSLEFKELVLVIWWVWRSWPVWFRLPQVNIVRKVIQMEADDVIVDIIKIYFKWWYIKQEILRTGGIGTYWGYNGKTHAKIIPLEILTGYLKYSYL